MINRRLFGAGLLAAPFAQSAFTSPAVAQTWQPSGPIRMVVAYPAGGPTDVIARIVAADIAGSLGQQVLVENLSGGAGAIGTRAVAKAKAEMKPGAWLVSLEFAAHELKPTAVVYASADRPVWLYQVPLIAVA